MISEQKTLARHRFERAGLTLKEAMDELAKEIIISFKTVLENLQFKHLRIQCI